MGKSKGKSKARVIAALVVLGIVLGVAIYYLAQPRYGDIVGGVASVITVEYVDGTTETFYTSEIMTPATLYYPASGGSAISKVFQQFDITVSAGGLSGTWWTTGTVTANRGTTNVTFNTSGLPSSFGATYRTPASCLTASYFSGAGASTATYTTSVSVSGTVNTSADVSNPSVSFSSSTSYRVSWTNNAMTVTVTPRNPSVI